MTDHGLSDEAIAQAYLAACRAELAALKPGNVHAFSAGHRMTVRDFERSAEVSASPLSHPCAGVGARVRAAASATRTAVGQNTNLGILLLCAPLASAAERPGDLQPALAEVLAGLDVADAVEAYAAIRLAAPGGLGRAERFDVAAEPTVDLRSAMAAASGHDRIALAYVTGFQDLFGIGLPTLAAARRRGLHEPWPTTAVYLAFLAAFPDTHVVRKHGPETARAVQAEAIALMADLALGPQAIGRLAAFDTRLKAAGLNPGTSADLTVATLFTDGLQARKAAVGACG